jgi:hypothetical protein
LTVEQFNGVVLMGLAKHKPPVIESGNAKEELAEYGKSWGSYDEFETGKRGN